MTEAELTPWYRATLDVDLVRQAEIDAIIDGPCRLRQMTRRPSAGL